MDSDEPSLVPQWLKGGAGNGSAYGNKDTDFDPSQKKSPFATWDSRGPARRTVTTDGRGVNDKSWKQPEQGSTQRDAFATARDNFTAPHRDFNTPARDTYSKLSSGLSSSRSGPVRPAPNDRPNSFGDRLDEYGHAAHRPRPIYAQRTSGNGPIALHRTESAPEGRVREHHPDHDLLRGPPPKPSFDRDFPSLARQTYVPREAPTKQNDFLSSAHWNSRLADAPAASQDPAPRTASGALSPFRSTLAAPPAPLSSPSSSSSTPATSPPSAAHADADADGSAHQPRMSDTLQQAQASVTAVDRTRLEQLAVKQSHKLIPVLASKAKVPGFKPQPATAAAVLSKPASLQRSASLGHGATTAAAAAARSAADLAKGGATAAGTATSATAPSNGLLTLKLAAPSGDRAKSRSHFFESLRRRAPPSDQAQQQDDAGDVSAAISDLIGLHLVSLSAADQPDDQQHDQSTQLAAAADTEADSSSADSPAPAAIADASAAVVAQADGGSDVGDGAGVEQDSTALLGPSAEEEAFLRSLGWTEASDDEEDCGLTDQEIAAFKAAAELRAKLPSCKLQAGSHGIGLANGHCVDACAGCSSSSDDESEM